MIRPSDRLLATAIRLEERDRRIKAAKDKTLAEAAFDRDLDEAVSETPGPEVEIDKDVVE